MGEEERRHYLLRYYRELFPVQAIFQWLRYIRTREFSFTMESGAYARYIVADRAEKLLDRIERDVPEKMDIGAAYIHTPAISNRSNRVVAKEIVFDVDLTDYKRECCKDKVMCNKCFPLIKCAIRVLAYVLETHLGMKKILFVFSGGRGVHCWVSDAKALCATARDRGNIIEYFSRLRKQEIKDEKIDQILLSYKDYCASNVSTDASNTTTTSNTTTISNTTTTSKKKDKEKDKENGDINISVLYKEIFPILDENVTKQPAHLLKSPFCIHPRTNRVCVPLLLSELDDMTLERIPTLHQVLEKPELLLKYTEIFNKYIYSLWSVPEEITK